MKYYGGYIVYNIFCLILRYLNNLFSSFCLSEQHSFNISSQTFNWMKTSISFVTRLSSRYRLSHHRSNGRDCVAKMSALESILFRRFAFSIMWDQSADYLDDSCFASSLIQRSNPFANPGRRQAVMGKNVQNLSTASVNTPELLILDNSRRRGLILVGSCGLAFEGKKEQSMSF